MDAPSVAQLHESGAVLLAKTTMCDVGMMSPGDSSKVPPTREPWGSVANQWGLEFGNQAPCWQQGLRQSQWEPILGMVMHPPLARFSSNGPHDFLEKRVPIAITAIW